MATTREVRVIINGEEFVSAAAKKAEGGMSGFMNQIPGWAKAAAVLTAAYAAISKAVGMVSDFVMDSFAVYDAFAASQTKMAAQSKLTGVSLDDLKAAAAKAREEFGLSTATANEAAITTAKYASRAGDASLQNKLLAASLDLGAAAGLTAAESMEAMEQGLRGQDEGFDKLLGKNPSTLWKEYADANGLAVGKMTDTQKRMAELTAIVDAGNIVQGAYNERLQTGAGQQEQMANKLDNAKIAFGQALQPIRMLVIQGLMKLIEVATPVVQAVGEMVNWFGVKWALSLANARGNIGGLVEALGKLVRSDSMQEWGAATVAAADKSRESIYKMMGATEQATTATVTHGKKSKDASVDVVDATKAQEKAHKEYVDNLKAWYKILDAEVVTYKQRLDTLNPAVKAAFETQHVDAFNKTLAASKEEADKAVAAMKQHGDLPPLVKRTETAVKDLADNLVQSARTALDVASAFGKIDNDAKAAFTSAINVGDAVSKMMTGGVTFGGVTAVIGGVASIVSQMMAGDAERKRLLNQNNERLRELRDRVGDLDLNVTGEDFAKATSALASAVPQFLGGIGNRGTDLRTLMGALSANGLSFGDLDRIAQEMGIVIRDKSGSLNFDLVKQLLQGLNDTEFATFGQDFASQLRAAMSGFNINGTSDAGQIGGLGALGAQFSPLLRSIFNPSDLAGSRVRLQEAFARMQSGGISAGELGGLTGNQFLDFITDLIGRIDRLGGAVGGPSVVGEITNGGGTIDIPGVGSVPVSAGDSMVAALKLQTDTLAPMIETGNAYLMRTADATETIRDTLLRIEAFLTAFDLVGTVDASMERTRQANALERGLGLVY